mgnify:CR=1 FL=1
MATPEKNTDAVYDASTLGTPKMLVLGLQHLFAMFGATVLVPAITGLNVSTTLLFAGLGTLLFHLITGRKVPAFLGSSFAFLGAYGLVTASGQDIPLTYSCFGVAVAGLVYLVLALFFKLFGAVRHAGDKIGIGTYTLNTEMDYRALILGMHNSSGNLTAETVTVTIPEGYTVMQTIRLMAEKGVNTEENLLEAAKTANYDYSFIDNSSEEVSRLEGYLFPDTYEFYKNHNAKNALGKLIDAFADHMDEDAFTSSKAKTMGYSMKDVVIIASLIEKETDGTDQADIASVIYNRLQNKGETVGLLQIDAALLYGLPDHTGAITNEDKAVDTPYNLYLHKGLPPTAIANPGSTALNAAMNPNDTDYYYYALGTDGRHHFSKTLAEHNAFVGSSSYGG